MMIYYIQTLITGLVILLIVFLHHIRLAEREINHKIFTALIASNAGVLLFELFLNFAHNSGSSRALITSITVVFYILNPLPSSLWVIFVLNHLQKLKTFRPLLLLGIFLPFIINSVVTILSIWGEYLFIISPENTYSRGPWFGILVITSYWNQVVALFLVFGHKKEIHRREFFALQFFTIPPILAGIIQVNFFGVSILWLATSISILIVYMDIQGVQSFTDHLTGLGNRRRFDRQLEYIFTTSKRKQGVGAILIDLNDFKQVNDAYGHHIGDRALEAVGTILQKSVRHNDLIARLGGDEFGILMTTDSLQVIEQVIHRIYYNLKAYNQQCLLPFSLSFSLGWAMLDHQIHHDTLAFLRDLDKKMYEHKAVQKKGLETR
jgi:diguanylate cyclase (GGDEF)-like protein